MDAVIPIPEIATVPVVGGGVFPVHRIYCVGRNYAEHAKEMGHSGREPPFFFMKPADAVLPAGADGRATMQYPSLTKDLHHEVELVVAIGKGGRDIAVADAASHIWGYAIGLDMTRRDLQSEMKKQGRAWSIAKGFDQSAPIGPIHPVSRTGILTQGAIALAVNGQPRQRGDLAALIWSIDETIAEISRAWALAPGDLIFSGTPAGVGAVARGDEMTASFAGLGEIRIALA